MCSKLWGTNQPKTRHKERKNLTLIRKELAMAQHVSTSVIKQVCNLDVAYFSFPSYRTLQLASCTTIVQRAEGSMTSTHFFPFFFFFGESTQARLVSWTKHGNMAQSGLAYAYLIPSFGTSNGTSANQLQPGCKIAFYAKLALGYLALYCRG